MSRYALQRLGIDIVHGCQLRCVGCPNSTLQPKVKRMPVESFRRMLAHVDADRVWLLRLFNFGEPLLHDNLAGMLDAVRDSGLRVDMTEISTNAQFCDFDQLASALRTRVLGRLCVSCDGDGTPAEYERLRPPSRWDKLLEFLRRAGELRNQLHPDLILQARTICSDPRAQARWRAVLEPLGWTAEFRDWLHLPDSLLNMTGRTPKVPNRECSFLHGQDKVYVDWDGTVVPCCVHPRAGVFGNLLEQPLSAILNGSSRIEFRRLMQHDRQSMGLCNECEF